MTNKTLQKIIVKGAREHNLNNINIDIPRNKLVVITGVSGLAKALWLLTQFMRKDSGDTLNLYLLMPGSFWEELTNQMLIILEDCLLQFLWTKRECQEIPGLL